MDGSVQEVAVYGCTARTRDITDCVYRLVVMTGLDGKKVLKLLPASKPLNNLKPLVQSPVVSHAVKGNVSLSVHDYAKTSFASTITSAAAKISKLKTIAARRLILPKPLNQLEQVNVTLVVKQNPITLTVSGIQSSYSADRSSLQKSFAPIYLDTSTTVVKIENTPLSIKPPMLPSDHHLQIPAHTKVKTLPVSVLPPVIQDKILATVAASNTSGTDENNNAPIFVSPVNTVKMPASESLETKSVGEVSSSLILATPQEFVNSSAIEVSTSGSMENKMGPIKWVVHENPQSSTSYLVPVKSSNKVASELLKTDMKNTKNNSTSILPVCSISLHESHAKMPSIKDDTLTMCNGVAKLYLLAKKEGNILSTFKLSKQESTIVRKQTSELISSVIDNAITNQVINLVLSKNKRIASNVKESKFSDNTTPYLESEVNKNFKTESTPSASPHNNLQISSISQHEAVSSGRSASIGINVAQKYVTKENTYDSTHKDLSSKAATDPTSPSEVHHAIKEEEEQVKISSGMPIWMKHIQEQQKKQYLQLRKKFGLFKEERVYLRRVSSVPSKNSEASVFSNSVQMNDIDNLMSTPIKSESEKEETIIGEEGGKLNIKRKIKAISVLENPKKRKNDVTTMQNSDFECNSSYSVMENLNNSCTQNLSEQEHSSFLQCPHNVSDPWVCNNSEVDRVLKSTSNCHENETALGESSFKKDIFPFSPPDLEETIKDEKITRLKLLLREREAALEALRKKMHQC
ncbi:ligand-dependent nuclear receptor-interacting factor 1 isoform X1 [Pantherophis guttatus]|uniref:Ligand-dependent nuclear receptor-interacting factor 1 isoform X1 n=1 Tax=Pantherophis guttatus TaxID=94885 RepID=A0A6P9BGW8_PANGU|nr:ligand-dependent nuclear receptor-interacting factor 1 isoform X1 [Pantherophis guttatus]